ncbi:RNase H domain-containing protein [Trichonephila clavipes]|nr:RNase H domain-containing protein [Trichonephila clavipes]
MCFLICTDSLSSLDSLKYISSSNNTILEIQKQLKSLRDKNISIDFAFVRGHTGVLGNERADWLARAATKRKIDIDVNIPKSFYKKITKERMVKSWNQEYLISNKGSITKKFFPTINKRLSCHHIYTNYKLTQFLTGHGNFKSYLNKFNLVPSSFCDCNIGGEENVILLCSKVHGTSAFSICRNPRDRRFFCSSWTGYRLFDVLPGKIKDFSSRCGEMSDLLMCCPTGAPNFLRSIDASAIFAGRDTHDRRTFFS